MVVLFLIILLLQWQRGGQIEGYANSVALAATSVDPTCVYDQPTFTSNNRVVFYYAPWCTACTAFRPEFDKAAKQITSNVCFVTVNADAQASGSSCLKAKSAIAMPTVQFEVGSDTTPHAVFNGSRTAAALIAWVNTLSL